MKKIILFLLLLALLFTCAACRRKNPDAGNQQPLPGTMEENVSKLIEKEQPQFMGGFMPLDLKDTSEEGLWALKGYTGLDSAESIADSAVYEPMTGAQAFSLVMVRVKNAADAKTVAQQMKENIDPRKWICAGADQVMVAGYGDTVLFVMADSGLGISAQSYVDGYKELCGGKVDFTL